MDAEVCATERIFGVETAVREGGLRQGGQGETRFDSMTASLTRPKVLLGQLAVVT